MKVPAWVLPLGILLTIGAWQWAEFVSSVNATGRSPGTAAQLSGATAPVSRAVESPRAEEPHAHAERGGAAHEPVPDRFRAMPNPLPALPEIVAKGQLAYQTYCWVCHGRGAQGNGPAAPGLDPRPYDLTSREVQKEPDGYLFYRISEGVKGTPMPAWKHSLDEQTRWAIIRYLKRGASSS